MSDDIFGKYEIIRRLSTGGMGEILLARQKGVAGSERTVIIKMILAHLAGDSEFVDRFTDESRIAASLSHGNIVQVFESGCWEGRFYMVMEHVDGLDLKEILRKAGPTARIDSWIPFFVHVLSETAKALTYAYNKKDDCGHPLMVVHRDVSPSNILISREGLVKLTDFGVAKATRRTSVTMPGRLHGKVNYMAPEQVRGLECDHRSDVFSLGVVGYEMLAGHRPFDGDSDVAVLEKIRSMTLTPLNEAALDVPPELSAIVMKAMAPDPDARWQTAEDFSAALLAWAHSNDVNLLSGNMAALLQGQFDTETPVPAGGVGLDQFLDNAVDDLMRTPAGRGERTGTISRPVETPAMPPGPAIMPRKAGRWAAGAGAAIFLAVAVLLVSRYLAEPAPASRPPASVVGASGTADVTAPPAPPADATRTVTAPLNVGATSAGMAEASPVAAGGTSGEKNVVSPAEPRAPADQGAGSMAGAVQKSQLSAVTKKPAATGRLIFRFFPADSLVQIDGQKIAVTGNLVEIDVPTGAHVLTVQSNKGNLTETRSFNIEPGSPLALGTIELGEVPGQ